LRILSHRQALKRILGGRSTLGVQLGRIEVGETHFNPSGRAGRIADTEAVAISNVPYLTTEGLACPSRQRAFAGVSPGDRRQSGKANSNDPNAHANLRRPTLAQHDARSKQMARRSA